MSDSQNIEDKEHDASLSSSSTYEQSFSGFTDRANTPVPDVSNAIPTGAEQKEEPEKAPVPTESTTTYVREVHTRTTHANPEEPAGHAKFA
jgi:hypothetical protein